MKNFSTKSNLVLWVLLIVSLMAFLAVENSKVEVKQRWYSEKLRASLLAKDAADYIRDYRLKGGIFVDVINDPNETALIGQEYTLTTTDRGYIEAKLSTTNPNFAAAIVDMLKEAGATKGDYIAIAYTGSFPGLNIATLAAIEVLQLKPIIISSVGASNFGANDPYFTWLDMESYLFEKGVFNNKSIAASIGGGGDRGRGLSPEGRNLIIESIKRNDVEFINEYYLENSINKRLEIYNRKSNGKPIKAYINVGGGIASLGASINGKLIPGGLSKIMDMQNYPVQGVIIKMAQEHYPIIHLLNISSLLAKYNLPNNPIPLPIPGEGAIFFEIKYNVLLTVIITLIIILLIGTVYTIDNRRHKLGSEYVQAGIVDNESHSKLKRAV
ncbi:hypothetical protein BMS3Abin03_02660 [bacterium BMS3Abin03]|nr:hypothetical protein BMS3Abin03_02660 [bacterium BMS3Abin03]